MWEEEQELLNLHFKLGRRGGQPGERSLLLRPGSHSAAIPKLAVPLRNSGHRSEVRDQM